MKTANSNPNPNSAPAPQPPRVTARGTAGYFHMHLEDLEGLVSALYLISGQVVEALGQDQSHLGGALKAVVAGVSDKAANLLVEAEQMMGEAAWNAQTAPSRAGGAA